MTITYGSVCSGIEAATQAWHPLGMRAAWFAEIEPFPSAVLAHHYPDVPNHGDMTKLAALVLAGKIPAPDVLVGGTPCQAFSVAGMREGLTDPRGALTIKYVELADAVDYVRAGQRKPASVIVWENVPGVLSDKGNAFGCFLGALAGEDCELQPSGKKWPDAGCVYGPKRTIAWRVLDAQYFGLAQRRRRVFVVASARKGFDPTEVLFEFDGVRRDTAPSRQAGQNAAAGTLRSTDGGSDVDHALAGQLQPVGVDGGVAAPVTLSVERPRGDGLDTLIAGTLQENGKAAGSATQQDAECGMLIPMAYGGGNQAGAINIATACRAHSGPHLDFESETFLVQQVAFPIQNATRGKDQNGLGIGDADAPMYTLDNGSQHGVALAPIAFSSKDYGGDACYDLSPTLRAGNHAGSHANAGSPPAIAFDSRQDCVSSTDVFGALGSSSPQAQAVCITGDITHTLKAEGFDASEDGTGRGQPIVAFQNRFRGDDGRGYQRAPAVCQDVIGTLETVKQWNLTTGMAVRRLTPRECERLQAFPDFYTLIPMGIVKASRAETMLAKGDPVECIDGVWWKMAADGPRYKALGNSMCTNNISWIGRRIELVLARSDKSLSIQ